MASSKYQYLYRVATETSHGYDTTHVTVWAIAADSNHAGRAVDDISALIASCTNNEIGYGSQVEADKQAARLTALRDQGATGVFSTYRARATIEFKWQHYKPIASEPAAAPEYCDGEVKMPTHARELGNAIKVWQRMSVAMERKAGHQFMRTPEPLLTFLRASKATQLHDYHTELCTRRTRPAEYQLTR